jgi:hypothetical protein
MLKLSTKCCISAFKCTRFESNYSSCKGRRSENLCNNSGGAQGKKKDKVKLRKPSKFPEFQPPLNANVLFCMVFFNLTLCMTKLRVLVLSFPDFTNFTVTEGHGHPLVHNIDGFVGLRRSSFPSGHPFHPSPHPWGR